MKEELITLEGQIDEVLPGGRFGVQLDNGHRIIEGTHRLSREAGPAEPRPAPQVFQEKK